MKMRKQVLQCFAERRDGVWLAYCLELGLGTQAPSYEEARQNLETQIHDLTPEEVRALLRQGSPASLRLRYRLLLVLGWILRTFGGSRVSGQRKRFTERLPAAMACP